MENHVNMHVTKQLSAIFTFIVVLASLTSSCSKPTEDSLFREAKVLAASGEYAKAESLLAVIISTFPHSHYMDVYYQSTFAVLNAHRDSLQSTAKQQPHSPVDTNSRGMVDIILRAAEPTSERELVRARIIEVGEEYLRHQHGSIKGLVEAQLMRAYAGNRVPRFYEITKAVRDSGNLYDRTWANLFLGLYARADTNYQNAASYFLKFSELSVDSSDKAKGILYAADCYYMADNINTALDYLEKVKMLEPISRGRLFSGMADLWRPEYIRTKASPIRPKKEFVHVIIK